MMEYVKMAAGVLPVLAALWPHRTKKDLVPRLVLRRYHVSYFQDCAYAAMVCVVAVDACSEQEAREHYPSLAQENEDNFRDHPKGYARKLSIQPAYGDNSIEEIHLAGENPDGDCPLCKKGSAR